MQTITKYFKSIKQAEKYQNKLYSMFPYVRLADQPLYSEEGRYTWYVSI